MEITWTEKQLGIKSIKWLNNVLFSFQVNLKYNSKIMTASRIHDSRDGLTKLETQNNQFLELLDSRQSGLMQWLSLVQFRNFFDQDNAIYFDFSVGVWLKSKSGFWHQQKRSKLFLIMCKSKYIMCNVYEYDRG